MDERITIELVETWPRLLPGCYEALDELLSRRSDRDPGKLPVSAVYLYIYDVCRSQQKAGMLASELTACWLWQRFGAARVFALEHTALLARQAEDGSLRMLPARQLMALPRPIIYCQAPQLLEMMDGFFCWINEETARDPELRIQWLSNDQKHSVAQVLPLRPGATLRDCFWAAFPKAHEQQETPEQQQAKKMEGMLWKALPFVLELAKEVGPRPETVENSGVPAEKRRFPFWPKRNREQ